MDVIELTKKLIEFDTTNPPGTDRKCPNFIASIFKENNIPYKIIEKDGVINILAELDFGEGKTLCFNGHWDVVPATNDWKVTKPFEPKIVGNKLYGRGSCDMKGGLAASLCAFIRLKDRKDLKGKVVFMVVGDEEVGGFRGTSYIAETYKPKYDYAIVGEPTNMDYAISRRGLLEVTIKTYGKSAHGSSPEKGINALEQMAKAMNELMKIKMTYDKKAKAKPTFTMTMLESGNKFNIIPDYAELTVDCRYDPSQNEKTIRKDIIKALKEIKNLKYKIEIKEIAAPYKSKEGNIHKVTEKYLKEIFKKKPKIIGSGGNSDVRFLSKLGAETIECGPEINMHEVDEWVGISTLKKLEEFYYKLAAELMKV